MNVKLVIISIARITITQKLSNKNKLFLQIVISYLQKFDAVKWVLTLKTFLSFG